MAGLGGLRTEQVDVDRVGGLGREDILDARAVRTVNSAAILIKYT